MINSQVITAAIKVFLLRTNLYVTGLDWRKLTMFQRSVEALSTTMIS